MGKHINKYSKVIADAALREDALIQSLKFETDGKALQTIAAELSEIRQVKTEAKSSLIANETEFECALHFKDGLPATFNSTDRVVLEISAAFIYEGEKKPVRHHFGKRPSYLVVCAKCATKFKIIQNLTDTLEE